LALGYGKIRQPSPLNSVHAIACRGYLTKVAIDARKDRGKTDRRRGNSGNYRFCLRCNSLKATN